MPFDAKREVKAQGIALMVKAFTGNAPELNRQSDYTEVILDPEQILHGQNLFLNMLESEPGDVRIQNSGDIFFPILIKKYWPWAAALAITGGLIGVALKR